MGGWRAQSGARGWLARYGYLVEVVAREGRLNVIKEGGVTQSCKPLHTYSRYGKYRAGKLLGTRGYYTCERGKEGGGSEVAKDLVVSRTFYSVSSGWRLLSASQRTNSSSLPIPPAP